MEHVSSSPARAAGSARRRRCASRRAGREVVCVDIDGDAARRDARPSARATALARVCDVADAAAVARRSAEPSCGDGRRARQQRRASASAGRSSTRASRTGTGCGRSTSTASPTAATRSGAAMVERGRGQVVNVASGAAYIHDRDMAAYCASKAAVVALSHCLRADWRAHGVGVSVDLPGRDQHADRREHAHVRRAGRAARSGSCARSAARPLARPRRQGDRRRVERNPDVVPVGFESELAYRLLPFVPAADPGRWPPRPDRKGHMSAEHHRVVIIGAGFAGVGLGVRLLQRGDRRLRDPRAQRVGRRHLVRAHLSRLRLRHPDAPVLVLVRAQPELDAAVPEAGARSSTTCAAIADEHGVTPHIRFGCEMERSRAGTSATAAGACATADGELTCDVLVSAIGATAEPDEPDIPGLDDVRRATASTPRAGTGTTTSPASASP